MTQESKIIEVQDTSSTPLTTKEDAPTSPVNPEAFGGRIRAARGERSMSLRELARRLDISAGHISQVERGLVMPSISLVYSIASELSLDMSDLFGDNAAKNTHDEGVTRTEGEQRFVTRAAERRTIDLETGVRWELLTPTPREPVNFREIVYPIGAGSALPDAFVRHSGREYGLMLSGVLRVQLDFEEFELGPGDSIAFDSTVPHRFWNGGTETVRAVWCMVESTPGESCGF